MCTACVPLTSFRWHGNGVRHIGTLTSQINGNPTVNSTACSGEQEINIKASHHRVRVRVAIGWPILKIEGTHWQLEC